MVIAVLLDLASVFAIALVASLVACRIVIAAGPRDLPNEPRKAHGAPTPTSGGVGIGLGYAVGMVALSLYSLAWRHEVSEHGVRLLWISALFSYPLLVMGVIDDARGLGARLKFMVYAALSFGGAWSAGVVLDLPMGAFVANLPYVVGLVGTALWIFTLLNAVNFMDGANGLSMGSVATGLLFLAAIALERGSPAGSALALCGAGALIGFLVWNFPNGRLFAGDSGALFAGGLAAFGSLIVIARTDLSPFVPPMLFFPVLADVLLTLLYRVRRGQSLLVAHSEHLYQLAISAGLTHVRVALTYWAASAACGVIAIAASRDETGAASLGALLALAALAVAIDVLARRWALRRRILAP